MAPMRKRDHVLGGGVWSPGKLSDLAIWLRADAITDLADGDPVTTWADSSGNGNNATQSTPSKRPLWKTGIVNGLPVVRFDATDDHMIITASGSDLPQGQPFTLMSVTLPRNVTSGPMLWGTTTNDAWSVGQSTTHKQYLATKTRSNYISTGASLTAAFHVLTYVFDSGFDATFYLDGTATTIAGTLDATALTGDWVLSAYTASSLFWGSDIAELFIVRAALSGAELVRPHTYAGSKYGITIA